MTTNKISPKILEEIQSCALQVSSSNWIPGYDKEDIYQEAVIIGIEGIKWYNHQIPLEKYLINHMKHRLRSLRKEKFLKPGCNCGECLKCQNNQSRHNLEYCVDVDEVSGSLYYSVEDSLEKKELEELLDQSIPAEYRDDYLKLKAGITIIASRKKKLKQIISELLNGD